MTMMNTTILFVQVMYGPWFIIKQDHNCGPIENGKAGWDPVLETINQNDFTHAIFTGFTFFPLMMSYIAFAILVYFLYGNSSDTIKMFAESKKEEYRQTIMEQGN